MWLPGSVALSRWAASLTCSTSNAHFSAGSAASLSGSREDENFAKLLGDVDAPGRAVREGVPGVDRRGVRHQGERRKGSVLRGADLTRVCGRVGNESSVSVAHRRCCQPDREIAGHLACEFVGIEHRMAGSQVLIREALEQPIEIGALDRGEAARGRLQLVEAGQGIGKRRCGRHRDEKFDALSLPSQRGMKRLRNPPRHAPAEDDGVCRQTIPVHVAGDDLGALLRPVRDRKLRECGVEHTPAVDGIGQDQRRKAFRMQPMAEEIGGPSAGRSVSDATEHPSSRDEHHDGKFRSAGFEPHQGRIAGRLGQLLARIEHCRSRLSFRRGAPRRGQGCAEHRELTTIEVAGNQCRKPLCRREV